MTMTKNNNIRSMDVPIMDKVFAMESGWVLNLANRTFAEFFREDLGVDIDHLRWAVQRPVRRIRTVSTRLLPSLRRTD